MSTELRGHSRKAGGIGIQMIAASREYETTAARNFETAFLTE
jgi:hypothetical protein